MAVTQNDLTQFQEFASARVAKGDVESLESLFDQWLLAHPSDEQARADLASIERGIQDADAGRTKPATEAFEAVRPRLVAEP